MLTSSDAYFHVVRLPTTIDILARQLYGDASSALAQEFRFVNQLALIEGIGVVPGQMLYLPEPVCYHPDLQDEIIRFVGSINDRILFQMDNQQRNLLAEHPTFVSNVAESPNIVVQGLSTGNAAASALMAATTATTRSIGESLKSLERAYQQAFRTHGRLTPDFYIRRRQIYSQLDTRLGRLGRTLALGTPFDQHARASLKVHTKSTALHWKRHGTGPIAGFQGHFDRLARTTRWLRLGGYATLAIDVALNEYAITDACNSGDAAECSRQTYALRGKSVGLVAGGLATGSLATYGICNAVFGPPTAGSSFLWCALVLGGASATAGAYSFGLAGEKAGNILYETTIK